MLKFLLLGCIFASLHSSSLQFKHVTDQQSQQIDNNLKRAMLIVDQLLKNEADFMEAVSKGNCNEEQLKLSNDLSDSLENLLKSLLMTRRENLSNVKLSKINNIINAIINNPEKMSLTMDVLIVNIFDNLMLKYNLNLCSLKSGIAINASRLDVEFGYTLNGSIGGSPISGDGNVKMNMEDLYLADETSVNCKLSGKDSCELTLKDSKDEIRLKKGVVKITGLKYKDMDEEKINAKINNFIEKHLISGHNETSQSITNVLKAKKTELLNSLDPVRLLKTLKKGLNMVAFMKPRKQHGVLGSVREKLVSDKARKIITEFCRKLFGFE